MRFNRYIWSSIFLIFASIIAGIVLYPSLPVQVASHWDLNGNVDGYISRFWGVFLMPIISIAILILFLIIPKIDPLKKNINIFIGYFNKFIFILIVFFFYIHLLTLFWNFGFRFNMGQFFAPAFAVLFYMIGLLIEHSKQNWFIGIRTPWTLSSPAVWEKTHKLGGKFFKIGALIMFFGLFFPHFFFIFVILSAITFSLFSFIYSYYLYRKLDIDRSKK